MEARSRRLDAVEPRAATVCGGSGDRRLDAVEPRVPAGCGGWGDSELLPLLGFGLAGLGALLAPAAILGYFQTLGMLFPACGVRSLLCLLGSLRRSDVMRRFTLLQGTCPIPAPRSSRHYMAFVAATISSEARGHRGHAAPWH